MSSTEDRHRDAIQRMTQRLIDHKGLTRQEAEREARKISKKSRRKQGQP